jgi:hypothetical protein
MVAPGIMLPVESRTLPFTEAVDSWAASGATLASKISRQFRTDLNMDLRLLFFYGGLAPVYTACRLIQGMTTGR